MSERKRLPGAISRLASTMAIALTMLISLVGSALAQSTPTVAAEFPPFSTPAALPDAPAPDGGALKVVTSTNIIGDLVRQIGGDRVEVTTILPANADPHDYEPSPKDVATLEGAKVVFVHGLGLDAWTESIIDNSGGDFSVVTVTDGIAMGHEGMRSSLPSREVIADSVELTMRGHGYDALVGLAGCDKSLPGMMMAMLRLNVPSAFLYGGSILPGAYQGREVTVQDVFEGVGRHSAGAGHVKAMLLSPLCLPSGSKRRCTRSGFGSEPSARVQPR